MPLLRALVSPSSSASFTDTLSASPFSPRRSWVRCARGTKSCKNRHCSHLSWDACAPQKAWMYLHKGTARLSLARIFPPPCYCHVLSSRVVLSSQSRRRFLLHSRIAGCRSCRDAPANSVTLPSSHHLSYPRVQSLLPGFASTLALPV
jgi:hypothetical protein